MSSWDDGRPIFNRLPAAYRLSEPADWLTVNWDEELISAKLTSDNFYQNYLDPATALTTALDWLAQMTGFTGQYWDSSYPEAIKRTLISNAYQVVWPQKGSRALLQWLIDLFALEAALYVPGQFLASVNAAGDALGDGIGLEYYIVVSDYLRPSAEWRRLEEINHLYGPVYARSRIIYDFFYAGLSAAGDPVFEASILQPTEVLSQPFAITLSVEITRSGQLYVSDFTPTEVSSSNTYYVDPSGSDSNDGLTVETAFATVRQAIETLNASAFADAVILVTPGTYNNGWTNRRPSKNLTIKTTTPGQKAVFQVRNFPTWDDEGGGVWSAVKASSPPLTHAVDTRLSDDEKILTFVTSVAEVRATPSSQFLDGTRLYVHLIDGSEPKGSTVKAFYNQKCGGIGDDWSSSNGNNVVAYVQDCVFEGGNVAFSVNGLNMDVTLVDCEFKFAFGHGVDAEPPSETVDLTGVVKLIRCRSACNTENGFRWVTDTAGLEVYSEGCSTQFNQGNGEEVTTPGISMIRVNNSYQNSGIHGVLDASTAQTWSVGCVLRDNGFVDFSTEGSVDATFDGTSTVGSSSQAGLLVGSGTTTTLRAFNEFHLISDN